MPKQSFHVVPSELHSKVLKSCGMGRCTNHVVRGGGVLEKPRQITIGGGVRQKTTWYFLAVFLLKPW